MFILYVTKLALESWKHIYRSHFLQHSICKLIVSGRILHTLTKKDVVPVPYLQHLPQTKFLDHDLESKIVDSSGKKTSNNEDSGIKPKQEYSKNWNDNMSNLVKNGTKILSNNNRLNKVKQGSKTKESKAPSAHFGSSDWKSLAISVFCGTPGNKFRIQCPYSNKSE